MSEDPPAASNSEKPADGVFAKLPDSRPGTRSPRRAAGERAAAARPEVSRATQRKRSSPPPRRAPSPAAHGPPAGESRTRQRPEPAPDGGGGLEDVAWAGIAAAAEAATIGVRLASRAIEALRGNPGQR